MEKFREKFGAGVIGRGNPYKGGIEQGIAYDLYELNRPIIQQNAGKPRILGGYQSVALDLLNHFSTQKGSRILEIGSGTGIGTLELVSLNPTCSLICIESSEGMIELARYKFNHLDEDYILRRTNDLSLIRYWTSFRSRSLEFKDNVKFLMSNFEDTILNHESIDSAIAFSSLYHTDLTKSFRNLYNFLTNNGFIIWDGSSHFYDDKDFPSSNYGFRYNDFLGYVLDEIGKKLDLLGDYRNLSKPKVNLDEIMEITLKEGLFTEKIAIYLTPVDLQIFIKNFVPHIVRVLVPKETDEEYFNEVLKEGIGKAITNPSALNDNNHKYGIKAIFKSKKI